MNYYKISVVIALFTIGFGLIANSVVITNASNQLPALLTYPTENVESSEFDFVPNEVSFEAEVLPDYESVLVQMHSGQWFGWSDSSNKIYENLIIHDNQYDKPPLALLESLLATSETFDTARKLRRQAQRSNRSTLETKFINDNFTNADIVEYLRLLGDF